MIIYCKTNKYKTDFYEELHDNSGGSEQGEGREESVQKVQSHVTDSHQSFQQILHVSGVYLFSTINMEQIYR